MLVTADTATVGQHIRCFGRLAVVTRIEGDRIYFRYILKGVPSKTERNTRSCQSAGDSLDNPAPRA